ncbi:MAG: hypothetical protein GEU26_01175 [Nitrososphaeraceae archaeon]|nr:hypothetical protein [Nitrososphaeraceae archaeon]
MKVDKKSISNMSNRLDRIEEEIGLAPFSSEQEQEQILLEQALEQARRRLATTATATNATATNATATNATAAKADLFEEFALRFWNTPVYARSKILDKMSREEEDRLDEYRFNWYVKNILPYYKQEVCRVHNISSEEYDRRTLNADESIYLPQPNPKFESTWYSERVAHVLGLDYKGFQDKVRKGELEDKIATGGFGCWRDENPNAVF